MEVEVSEVKALHWFLIHAIVGDMNEEKIIGKLEEHDKRFDAHDKQLDLLAAKALEHDKRFDVIEKRFDEHDKRFDGLEAKVGNVEKLCDRVLTALDANSALLRDIRQEQLATSATLTRHDERITKLEPKAAV